MPSIVRNLLAVIVLVSFQVFPMSAQAAPMSPEWVHQAPSVEQVFAEIKGDGDLDTKARQAATFDVMRMAIMTWTDTLDPRNMPPRGAKLFRAYGEIGAKRPWGLKFNDGACWGPTCIRGQFYGRYYHYSVDPAFIKETLSRWFDKPYVDAHLDWVNRVHSTKPTTATYPQVMPTNEDSAAGFLIAVGIILTLLYLLYRRFRPKGKEEPKKRPVSDNYGRASYAPLQMKPASEDASSKGVFLGQSSEPPEPGAMIQPTGAPVFTTESRHTLIVAQTRTGKGTRVIIPTLLRYGNSMVVVDPKGENALIAARVRRDILGHNVHILNPWNYMAADFDERGFTSDTYNPLDILNRDDPDAVTIAQAIANSICPTDLSSNSAFWTANAAALLSAILLWLTDQPGETKTLGRARTLVGLSRQDFTDNYLVKMAASTAFDGAIAEFSAMFIDLAAETYSGILANLRVATDFLGEPLIKAHVATSSFAMTDLASRPTTIFLIIPPDRIDTHRTWLKLVIGAATQSYREVRSKPLPAGVKKRPPVTRCMILIDELPALRRIPDLPRDLATLAGYGVDFTLIVQGLDQLNAVYDKDAATIVGNCSYIWFCNVKDLESAKKVSESIGDKTVSTMTQGENSGTTPQGGTTSGTSTNYGETGRRLLKPEEVLTLGRDVAIVLPVTGQPLYLVPVDYWNLDNAFGTYAKRYPKLFSEPPLQYDPNPYFQS